MRCYITLIMGITLEIDTVLIQWVVVLLIPWNDAGNEMYSELIKL